MMIKNQSQKYLFLTLVFFLTLVSNVLGQNITTVAGTGNSGYNGDHINATTAMLYFPEDLAVDDLGNIFIADLFSNRIRKVNASGIITTVAGTGIAGYSGDGGAATDAELSYPISVALDKNGNLFFADHVNHRIRKVDASGIITTVAGTGIAGYSGDGDLATAAQLHYPVGISIDLNGSLYIADMENHRIRKVDASGIITTVAGTGIAGYSGDGELATVARFSNPTDICLDINGNIYISDFDNNRIRKVDASGIITTVAGTGIAGFSGDSDLATAAALNHPDGITTDDSGNLYIADYQNHRIRKVDASGIITTVAGTGIAGYSGDGELATAATLNYPDGVSLDRAGNLYIVDINNHCIRKVTPSTPTVYFEIPHVNTKVDATTISFAYQDAKPGNLLELTISSDGGNAEVRRSETIISAKGQITGIDVSSLEDGLLTLAASFTDTEKNTSIQTSATIIKDLTPPTAVVQNFNLSLDANGKGTLYPLNINNGSVDNLGTVNLELGRTSFSCSDLGKNTVDIIVSDENGNTSTTTAIITVEDKTPPTFKCPANVVYFDVKMATIGLSEVMDECGTTNVTYQLTGATAAMGTGDASKEQFNEGITAVTYTVEDNSGNASTCTFHVTKPGILSLQEEQNNFIELYPNPVNNGILTVNMRDMHEDIQISFIDLAGKLAYQKNLIITTQKTIIDVSDLRSGVYFVKIKGRLWERNTKLIIQK